MKDRIRQIMESQHMTQKTFASFIDMSEGSLSSIFNGRTKPTLNIVDAIKRKMPAVSTDWLLFGKGKMYVDENDDPGVDGEGADQHSPLTPQLAFDDMVNLPYPTTSDSMGGQSAGRQGRVAMKPDLIIKEAPKRQITEIRVFFDDQTWESFVPKK